MARRRHQQLSLRTYALVSSVVVIASFGFIIFWTTADLQNEAMVNANMAEKSTMRSTQANGAATAQVEAALSVQLEIERSRKGDDTLNEQVEKLREEVVRTKKTLPRGHFMETDRKALDVVGRFQDATRKLLAAKYGKEPYLVALDLEFPLSMAGDRTGRIVVELAPAALMPHAVHVFLHAMVDKFNGGSFMRNAPHVLQAEVGGSALGLAFQEYSREYTHKLGTLGYAGRPGGPGFYISIQDNSENHGPGSQQAENPHEADSCFGKIVVGWDSVVLGRMRKQPGGVPPHGFVTNPRQKIRIVAATLLST
eukprot:TRINITY_DN11399_c0_g1_i1.p1 TRINITY_DN11399_c0_g1~~TRINITY_DN11399_c0_g1_i1.p1  ORF type:complete len:310 (+),score=49.05 TRINITY_DN11399_c0_g1_i1:169-1098(+)